METKRRKKLLNAAMVVLIALIAFCGFMAVGTIKGWFDGSGNSFAKAEEASGIVNIERSGVAYSLDKDTVLKSKDIIETRNEATATLLAGDNTYAVAENSEAEISGVKKEKLSINLAAGEAFININESGQFKDIEVRDYKITADKTVFSINAQTGSLGINVFEGEVTISQGQTSRSAKAGESINVSGTEMSVSKLKVESLNKFNIENAKKANSEKKLCFSDEDLDKVIAEREKEIKQAKEEQAKHEEQVIAAGEAGLSSSSSSGTSGSAGGNSAKRCTIQIRCDTILNNMGSLTAGKEAYVPKNGVILATSTVEFNNGDTVFDVLKRACSAAGIQLEYSYTPMYGSYYIEGINHLYEFDCGEQSGWMYKVNGWFPNYGCSSYKLKNGDAIVWTYTCKGLGADVGGSVQ